MRFGSLIIVAACHEPVETHDAEPMPPACDDVQYAATFVDSTVFGPVSGTNTSVTIPITPTTGGELLVIAIASTTGDYGWVRMIGGTSRFQVGIPGDPCGKPGLIFSVGNIEPGVSSFTIDTEYRQRPPEYAGFVMRFAGLAPDAGARLSYDYDDASKAVPACPGTVIVSAAASCGDVSLSRESPFIAVDPIDGMAAAYYIPSEPGRYPAEWATSPIASAIVQLE